MLSDIGRSHGSHPEDAAVHAASITNRTGARPRASTPAKLIARAAPLGLRVHPSTPYATPDAGYCNLRPNPASGATGAAKVSATMVPSLARLSTFSTRRRDHHVSKANRSTRTATCRGPIQTTPSHNLIPPGDAPRLPTQC